jgi:uncharacterized protein (DUF1800 family)
MTPSHPETGPHDGRQRLSRGDFLRLAGLLSAGALASACAPITSELAHETLPDGWGSFGDGRLAHSDFQTLNRLTFGPRLEERQHVSEIGILAWIEEQLAPEQIDDLKCNILLRRFDTLKMRATELVDWSDKLFDDQDQESVPNELRQATLIRQVFSQRQIYELMVAFWTDHFNISVDKGDCWFLKSVDDRQVIRKHALGNFHDLLSASAQSPAMLVYLDNQSNKKGNPNENYARELMELHTLGVDGGYTQDDVMELARCLTGWTVKEHFWRGEFTFDEASHDPGIKTVLGEVIPHSGQAEAQGVIDSLAAHPSTARYIATKLARYFIADRPPDELVTRAADAFLESGGQIKDVLRLLLLDGLPHLSPRFKCPVRFVTSALRQLNAKTDGGAALQDTLLRLGQPYYGWPTPDGYPLDDDAWLGNLMPRWQFANNLAFNNLEGTKINHASLSAGTRVPNAMVKQLSYLLLGRQLPSAQRQSLVQALTMDNEEIRELPASITAILLASPGFQWH